MARKFRYDKLEIKNVIQAEINSNRRDAQFADIQEPIYVSSFGTRRPLGPQGRTDYLEARDKPDNNEPTFEILSFNAPYDRKTVVIFQITDNDWEFQDPPIEIKNSTFNPQKNERFKDNSNNFKKAKLVIPKHGTRNDSIEHKYTLLYQKIGSPDDKKFHDPMIKNGTEPPETTGFLEALIVSIANWLFRVIRKMMRKPGNIPK